MKVVILLLLVSYAAMSAAQCDCTDASGGCRNNGDEWTDRDGFCYERRCSSGSISTTGLKCLHGETCFAAGESVDIGNCQSKNCASTASGGIGYNTQTTGCKDSSGGCQEAGATGFSANIDGTEYDNCSCSDEFETSCSSGKK